MGNGIGFRARGQVVDLATGEVIVSTGTLVTPEIRKRAAGLVVDVIADAQQLSTFPSADAEEASDVTDEVEYMLSYAERIKYYAGLSKQDVEDAKAAKVAYKAEHGDAVTFTFVGFGG